MKAYPLVKEEGRENFSAKSRIIVLDQKIVDELTALSPSTTRVVNL